MIRHLMDLDIPVEFSCRYFAVSRSRYYQWASKGQPARLKRKAEILKMIATSFKESHGTYGSPRIWQELRHQGVKISENTVACYMQELGLDARLKKRFRVQTTDSNHPFPVADRIFRVEDHHTLPTAPGELLAGDITYLKLGDGFIYLAVILDVFTREVVGWSIQDSLKTDLVLEALRSAMHKTSPDAEVIFHSDRGSQYASEAYRNFLAKSNIKPSMSRRGNCYDNSYVESWFSSLKKEWLYRRSWSTESELRTLVFQYIEVWYNRKRKHSALGYVSPEQYRQKFAAAH